MRGESSATSVRSLPFTRSLSSWSVWANERREQQRVLREQRLATAERLASETRRARRTGEPLPPAESARRWC
jgi:hypothetical protein